jgi:hypothetical protein
MPRPGEHCQFLAQVLDQLVHVGCLVTVGTFRSGCPARPLASAKLSRATPENGAGGMDRCASAINAAGTSRESFSSRSAPRVWAARYVPAASEVLLR